MNRRISFAALFLAAAVHAEPIKVSVSFQEALAPQDTTSSARFQQEYESAIGTGKTLLGADLKKCGYEIVHSSEFYEASDPLQAKERAAKAQKEGAWLVVGPRRSNHYLLTAQGADATPTVSVMANSSEVFALGKMHRTLGISNESIARALAKVARSNLKASSFDYVTIVNEDCVFCLDLARSFDSVLKSKKKVGEIRVVGDTPDLDKIKRELGAKKPSIVFLPNYSRSSSIIMAGLKESLPKAIFLGGDGWGTNGFGYVQNSSNLGGVIGYTARGSIPSEAAMKTFRVGRALLKNPLAAQQFPESNTALSILKIMEGLTDLLCKNKPKTRADFSKAFQTNGSSYMKPSWGVGVYKLENADIRFYRAESL